MMVLLSKGMGAQELRKGTDMWIITVQKRESEHEWANCAQIICKEVKKTFHKQSHKRKKYRENDSKSDSDSDYSS
jgi:hypothetical protein